MSRAGITVIGIGSPFGDDRLGWLAAEALRASPVVAADPDAVRIVVRDRPGFMLMSDWRGAGRVLLIDAICSGAAPGSHRVLTADEIVSGNVTLSTHGFGVATAVELARVLGQLPPLLMLHGLEIDREHTGNSLSPRVQQALAGFVDLLATDLARLLRS
jgi:hydrogenase maturation protease